jgi:hypothetical protein
MFIEVHPRSKKGLLTIPIDQIPKDIVQGDHFSLSFTAGIFGVLHRRWNTQQNMCTLVCIMNTESWSRLMRSEGIEDDPETLYPRMTPQQWR